MAQRRRGSTTSIGRAHVLALALPGYNGASSYSPDGTKIAFDQDAGPFEPNVHGIFVANAGGSDPQRLVTGLATPDSYDTHTEWSPDGTRIALTRFKNESEPAIFVVGANGRGLKTADSVASRRREPEWWPAIGAVGGFGEALVLAGGISLRRSAAVAARRIEPQEKGERT